MGRLGGKNDDLLAKLGNDVAIKAYREGKLPFPEGTTIARLARREVTSKENNMALGDVDSFATGTATNLEVYGQGLEKVPRRADGVCAIYRRQTRQRGAPQNLFSVPRACEG